jgi:hypothetical protein
MVAVDLEKALPPPEAKGPCTIIFHGFPCKTRENQDYRLTLSVTIQDGDFQGVIDAFKENGGAWLPDEFGEDAVWWMPWPCAAIKVVFGEMAETQPQTKP